MEGADEILPVPSVDGGFPADGRVHHREERRRHLDDRNAAHERRGHEPGEVADHPAAQRHDHGVAPASRVEQPVGERAPLLARLRALPGGDAELERPLGAERRGQGLAVERADVVVGDDGEAMRVRQPLARERAGSRERAARDLDAALGETRQAPDLTT